MPYLPKPLPAEVSRLYERLFLPRSLYSHLQVVHDTALELVHGIKRTFPEVGIDADAVQFGAATHDIGKMIHRSEIDSSEKLHERDGPELLLLLGVTPSLARFAETHGQWSSDSGLEDLLVALADQIWKGTRQVSLATITAARLARESGCSTWRAYLELDDLLSEIAESATDRLEYSLMSRGIVSRTRRLA